MPLLLIAWGTNSKKSEVYQQIRGLYAWSIWPNLTGSTHHEHVRVAKPLHSFYCCMYWNNEIYNHIPSKNWAAEKWSKRISGDNTETQTEDLNSPSRKCRVCSKSVACSERVGHTTKMEYLAEPSRYAAKSAQPISDLPKGKYELSGLLDSLTICWQLLLCEVYRK